MASRGYQLVTCSEYVAFLKGAGLAHKPEQHACGLVRHHPGRHGRLLQVEKRFAAHGYVVSLTRVEAEVLERATTPSTRASHDGHNMTIQGCSGSIANDFPEAACAGLQGQLDSVLPDSKPHQATERKICTGEVRRYTDRTIGPADRSDRR
jgi:hypothetical protein